MNYESKYLKYKEKYLALKKQDILTQGLSNNSRFNEKYINLKNQIAGNHNCPFRLKDIVRIIGPAGSPKLNIWGKIDGMKFDPPDPQLESVNQICTDIQLVIDDKEKIHIKPTEIELLENNEYIKGVFMLQAIPEVLGMETLKNKNMRELINMYDLRNPKINSIINKTKFDFTNPSEIPLVRFIEIFPNVKSLKIYENIPLGTLLHGLRNLRKLTFDNGFNQPLGTSLEGLVNLESLVFGNEENIAGAIISLSSFNQTLGASLNSLTNLKKLKFGIKFDNGGQPLGESLFNLRSLQTLELSQNFNQVLGNSLQNLRNLKRLVFGEMFNNGEQGLGNSFDNLLNLEELIFMNYECSLEDGQHAPFLYHEGWRPAYIHYDFNQDLDFLLNLRNLKKLSLGSDRRNILENSFANLQNLEELTLSGNIYFGDSLRYLTNLKRFYFQHNSIPETWGQSLINSLALLPAACIKSNDRH